MKRIAIIVILFLTGFTAIARDSNKPLIKTRAYRNLEQENQDLQRRIDSLANANASLQERQSAKDSLEAVLSSLRRTYGTGVELLNGQYSPEKSDSLLCLWYESRLAPEFDLVHEYDMDSVTFSSNVPDSVMIRRLKQMNSFVTLPFNYTVKNYMILYSEKLRASMGRVMGLSHYYFPIFEEAFARYGLPHELVYMAVIESMLVPTATSRAGAKGMWQFMYRTAKSYGLQIDSFVDDRLDVVKAADAAARYLRDSYMVFGDWALVISSYNCGPGNVNKAIYRSGGNRDFWSIYPYLPRETRGYVPAFVGAMYAFHYAKEYGISPMDVGMPAQVDTFHINRRLYFKQINEVTGVPMEDLRNLNPQFYREIVPGTAENPSVLKIPYNHTRNFMSFSLDSLSNYKKDEFAAAVLKGADEVKGDYIIYKVRRGDTLSGIAAKYRGVTAKSIMRENGLKSSTLRVGQKLKIPRR